MKKILFICYENPLLSYNYGNMSYWNSGDLVYIFPTLSYFYTEDITIITLSELDNKMRDKNAFKIFISNFDFAILNDANIFNVSMISNINNQICRFRNISIPIYIIGAGAQSDINYSTNFLKTISDDIKRYMDALLATGGGQ